MEAERDELKATSEDCLLEVDALSLEVAEMREKEELLDELCKKMDDVEVELNGKQEEVCFGDHRGSNNHFSQLIHAF